MSTAPVIVEGIVHADSVAIAMPPGETLPAAVRYATYPGNVTHMVGQLVGPNTLDEDLTAVSAEFDPEAGTTRVGFAYGIHGQRARAEAGSPFPGIPL